MALSGEDRRQELRQQISKEMNENLSGLEQDLSRLKLERDIALAEMEELSSTKRCAEFQLNVYFLRSNVALA
jgi:hypothetical protein